MLDPYANYLILSSQEILVTVLTLQMTKLEFDEIRQLIQVHKAILWSYNFYQVSNFEALSTTLSSKLAVGTMVKGNSVHPLYRQQRINKGTADKDH